MTKVAVDLASMLGLDHDGASRGISPFETEMRRRLWWQICTLDVRTAEYYGSDPHLLESSFDTKFPSNVNDASIHPDMSASPQPTTGRTEMLFTLVRLEISNFARRMIFSENFGRANSYAALSIWTKCKAIDQFRDRIERQYLSQCDFAIPLDFITAASSRLILAKLKLAVLKPRTRQYEHLLMQETFRKACVEILERARALQLYERGKQWLWLFQTYIEWDALAYLLINLSLVPAGNEVEVAWAAAEKIYNHWKSNSEPGSDRRWKNIEYLWSQALLAREMFQNDPGLFGSAMTNKEAMNIDVLGDGSSVEGASGESEVQESGHLPGTEAHDQVFGSESLAKSSRGQGDRSQLEIPAESPDIPTSGTACQWSSALFERYFEVLSSEQNMPGSWL